MHFTKDTADAVKFRRALSTLGMSDRQSVERVDNAVTSLLSFIADGRQTVAWLPMTVKGEPHDFFGDMD
eukprot:11213210-Lingulodinium_polyedra.AAC.1